MTVSSFRDKLLTTKMPILLGPADKKSEMTMPVAPLREGVVYPSTEVPLVYGRARPIRAIKIAYSSSDKYVLIVQQKKRSVEEPKIEEIYEVGTVCEVTNLLETDRDLNVIVRGLKRVKIKDWQPTEGFDVATVAVLSEIIDHDDEIVALGNHLTNELQRAAKLGKAFEMGIFMRLLSGLSPSVLADQIATILNIKPEQRQELLEQLNVKKRLMRVAEFLSREIKILELERNIAKKTHAKFNKGAREAVLRERKEAIERELGESSEEDEANVLKKKIKEARMPPEVAEKAEKELARFSKMSPYNPEAGYLRAYLETLVEMPWSRLSPNNQDFVAAEKILNEDHYGLEKIKERIIEYLAVMKLKHQEEKRRSLMAKRQKSEKSGVGQTGQDKKRNGVTPTILCFVGPPGVGKTSIGRSIAKALGREFVRISLGGIRDEAEIRGHRRTYVGALPGRIIQGIKQAGTRNPVFMLDEIDKVGADFRGDPSAALLEALDPEQNFEFRDHYMDVPFDLSEVMFITTANVLDTIPPALRDRLEIIHFPGYTENEKFHIGRGFLVNKQVKAHGLKNKQIEVSEVVLKKIIKRYTREAGVRDLERQIARVLRKVARSFAEGRKRKVRVTPKDLPEYLGPYKYSETLAEKRDEVGMATGLAWTQAGGDILFIEVATMPGKGALTLTGKLGEVMKESMKAAMSYIRARYTKFGLKKNFYKDLEIHVHVPEGAIPKDGPSAGIAITSAIVSALTGIPTRKDVGMTGEVTLRGRVLEIGAVKEKVIAAHRAGLKIIVLPKDNKKDLEEIPGYIKRDLEFKFVSHMDEVLKMVLTRDLGRYLEEKKKKNGQKKEEVDYLPQPVPKPLEMPAGERSSAPVA